MTLVSKDGTKAGYLWDASIDNTLNGRGASGLADNYPNPIACELIYNAIPH